MAQYLQNYKDQDPYQDHFKKPLKASKPSDISYIFHRSFNFKLHFTVKLL